MAHETRTSVDDRQEQVESQIQALMGHVKALEYGLRLLIATHPSPDVILPTLNRILTKRFHQPRLQATCRIRCTKRPSIRA